MDMGPATSRRDLVRTRAYREVSGSWASDVCLACSGGVDSTALLILAGEALRRGKVGPFVVMHVDHGSRPESASESTLVAQLCGEIGVPFVSLRVSAAGSVHGRSQEEVWRERRYAALCEAALARGINTIVTAHNRDDQVETILMRLFSGSATLGMAYETVFQTPGGTVSVLRPLLGVTRAELEDVLQIAGVTPAHDPSNADTRFRRNALRRKVVPEIERVFPGFAEPVIRSAKIHSRDAAFCDEVAAEVFSSVAQLPESNTIVIDRNVFVGLHPAIASRVVRLAANQVSLVADDRELTFERLDAVVAAVRGRTGAVIELPNDVRAIVERADVRICRFGEEP